MRDWNSLFPNLNLQLRSIAPRRITGLLHVESEERVGLESCFFHCHPQLRRGVIMLRRVADRCPGDRNVPQSVGKVLGNVLLKEEALLFQNHGVLVDAHVNDWITGLRCPRIQNGCDIVRQSCFFYLCLQSFV